MIKRKLRRLHVRILRLAKAFTLYQRCQDADAAMMAKWERALTATNYFFELGDTERYWRSARTRDRTLRALTRIWKVGRT